MNAVEVMMEKLNEVFAEFNDRMIEDSLKWLEVRYKRRVEFRNSDEYKDRSIGHWKKHELEVQACGGKYFKDLFDWGLPEAKIRFEKKQRKVIEARNAKIAEKLIKAEVKEVLDSEFAISYDGFNGCFKVKTDKGDKKINIDSIVAGGYNIQCFHMRVLVKVK